jgi:hypothetical protein
MKKIIPIIFLLTLSSCKFPKAISAFYSKEYCSCRFVELREHDDCHSYAQQMITVRNVQIDEQEKTVTSKALFFSTTAKWQSMRMGCMITD